MSKTTTEMQLISIDKLVPYVNNARTHSAEQIIKLRSSLREFGFVNPIIIDRDFNVIAGHGRLMAAKEEGINEVPCVFADFLTDAQKKALFKDELNSGEGDITVWINSPGGDCIAAAQIYNMLIQFGL